MHTECIVSTTTICLQFPNAHQTVNFNFQYKTESIYDPLPLRYIQCEQMFRFYYFARSLSLSGCLTSSLNCEAMCMHAYCASKSFAIFFCILSQSKDASRRPSQFRNFFLLFAVNDARTKIYFRKNYSNGRFYPLIKLIKLADLRDPEKSQQISNIIKFISVVDRSGIDKTNLFYFNKNVVLSLSIYLSLSLSLWSNWQFL